MIGRRRFALVAAAGALLVACDRDEAPQRPGDSSIIRFSILSTRSAQTERQSWAPIIKDMETSTDLTVTPYFARDDTTLIDAMRYKRADLGWFSNQSGLEAVRRANGEVFARTLGPSGADGAASILIVNAKSKLTLDKMLRCDKTLRLGMGDPLSPSGTLAPETYLFAPRGITPSTCFRQARGADHQANLLAVATGQLDVAANTSAALMLNRQHGGHEADEVRVIWRSPTLPEDPIIWRGDLDPAIKEKLRQFFLTYGQGDTPAAVRQRANMLKINIGGFRPADDSHLLPIREMEATRFWLEAKDGGDKARIAAARKALDTITAERESLEARTRTPAAAQ